MVDKEIRTCPDRPSPVYCPNTSHFRTILLILSAASVVAAVPAPIPPAESWSVEKDVAATPGSAPAIVTRAFLSSDLLPPPVAKEIVASAIRGLGARPSHRQIAAIVFAAVRSSPERVLEIVEAAARTAPPEAADEIATAAVSAVPNPLRQIVFKKTAVATTTTTTTTTATEAAPAPSIPALDFKQTGDKKAVVTPLEAQPLVSADGVLMTVAEAIVQTILAVQPGLNSSTLLAVVDVVIQTTPAALMGAINDPRGISGVGDAGNNNYSNEPGRFPPRVTTSVSSPPSTTISIRIATPAPVSR